MPLIALFAAPAADHFSLILVGQGTRPLPARKMDAQGVT